MTGAQLLAHVGPLGHHDIWVVIPMAVLTAVVMVVLARPRRPTTRDETSGGTAGEDGDEPPATGR